jgi:hypothetical protein
VRRQDREQPVFNLEVEGLHTYLVGQSGLVVHNVKEQPPELEVQPAHGARRQEGQAFAPRRKGRLSSQ